MHQFKLTGMRSQLPQCLNDAVTQPAAPVHGHARRFVENQQIVIFMNDPGLDSAPEPIERQTGLIPRGESYRRQPQYVADVQPIMGSDPATIETDLAGTEDPVDMTFGHSLQPGHQKIVDTLARVLGIDFDPLYRR
jgi:hypothetical protein